MTKEIPVGYQQIGASLKAVHPELEDAGRIFGATRLRTLADITAPLIRNGVVATWILIFIGSIRELSATILLFTARTKTVSVTMFDLRESNDWGPIAVLSVTMLAITFVLIMLTVGMVTVTQLIRTINQLRASLHEYDTYRAGNVVCHQPLRGRPAGRVAVSNVPGGRRLAVTRRGA